METSREHDERNLQQEAVSRIVRLNRHLFGEHVTIIDETRPAAEATDIPDDIRPTAA